MKVCMVGCAHYLDLGGLYHVTFDQLNLKEDFKQAGITAVLGIGASPGMVNVRVGKAAEMLDSIEEVNIKTGAQGGAKGFAYSAKTIIDEVTMRPAVFRNKKMEFVEPLLSREKYVLPEPEYSGKHKVFRIEVGGDKDGDSCTYLFETLVASDPKRELIETSIWTGVPMSVAAIMIAEGVISDKGVFAPELAKLSFIINFLSYEKVYVTLHICAFFRYYIHSPPVDDL